MAIQVDNRGEIEVPDCECDPGTQFLRTYLYKAIDAQEHRWNIKEDISDQELFNLNADIVELCIDQIDVPEMIRLSLRDITHNPKIHFPFVSMSNLNIKKIIKIAWEDELVNRYPRIKKFRCPDNFFSEKLAQQLDCPNRVHIKVDRIGQSCGVSGLWLNSKDVVEKCINWTLAFIPRDGTKRKKCHLKEMVKVEMVMCESLNPYKIFTSMMISKLLKSAGYTICTNSIRIADFSCVDDSTIVVKFDGEQKNSTKNIATWDLTNQWDQGIDSIVIPYTCARITSILDTYEVLVSKKEYPALLPFNLVDFSVISEAKEEVPLIMMLFYWPLVYRYSVNVKSRTHHQIDLLFLVHFIKMFGKKFEAFYSRVQVIVPKESEHSFNAMMARLYLLKAIKKVFEEFTDIFEISKNESESTIGPFETLSI